MAEVIKYGSSNCHEHIFKSECTIEVFANDNCKYFGMRMTRLNRGFIVEKYLSKHPNYDYLLQNATRLYFLTANLKTHDILKEGELRWDQFIDTINEENGGIYSYRLLGYALINNNKCRLTEKTFYTVEWIETFYKGKNLSELLLLKSFEHINGIILPGDTASVNPIYNEIYETRTHSTGIALLELFGDVEITKDFINEFISKNQLDWHYEFKQLIYEYLDLNND